MVEIISYYKSGFDFETLSRKGHPISAKMLVNPENVFVVIQNLGPNNICICAVVYGWESAVASCLNYQEMEDESRNKIAKTLTEIYFSKDNED